MINLTTGPIRLLPEVSKAFSLPPVSHRSPGFSNMLENIKETLCDKLNVKQTFLMTGSGTLANEAMLSQILLRGDKGLILSNGEFGERLAMQANRIGLKHTHIKKNWGDHFDLEEIRTTMETSRAKWLLFCHCESSTGILNPLASLTKLAKTYHCDLYVDCMSTFATSSLDLGEVAMATASSGKAIGSLAGLALVFANMEIIPGNNLPVYLDLSHYQKTNGVPFTMPSNLVAALHEAVKHNLLESRWAQLDQYSAKIYERLKSMDMIPFAKSQSRIFAITPGPVNAGFLGDKLLEKGIQLSYQSNYLVQRNWIELALFGFYTPEEIDAVLDAIESYVQQTPLKAAGRRA